MTEAKGEALLASLKEAQDGLEESKRELARLEGQREGLLKRLKEKFGASSLEEGRVKLKKMDEDITEKQKELAELITKIDAIMEEDPEDE